MGQVLDVVEMETCVRELPRVQSNMGGSFRRRTGVWARERQPRGSLRCGSSPSRSGGRACTVEDFTDVQLKTVGPLGLASYFLVAGLK